MEIGRAPRALFVISYPSIGKLGKNCMEIKRAGSQASTKGPSDWFTGALCARYPLLVIC